MRRVDAPLTGSSPRGRGKRPLSPHELQGLGLIPARAGKTVPARLRSRRARAHPRAGGENDGDEADPMSIHGSSPRGRGKRPPTGLGRSYRWLIPARAGKTSGVASAAGSVWAHPRAGGDHSPVSVALSAQPGSSPRGRGKQAIDGYEYQCDGLIPAQAGKTHRRAPVQRRSPAHPRAGGENWRGYSGEGSQSGSSPRGRGKLSGVWTAIQGIRLIPARAGKTRHDPPAHRGARAHPRAGGENTLRAIFAIAVAGSSPRGRGKHPTGEDRPRRCRLIPARAGKTNGRSDGRDPGAAHPRAGGENAMSQGQITAEEGSSPRGRGKRRRSREATRTDRLIPARAGKTSVGTARRAGRRAHPRAGGENWMQAQPPCLI